VCVCLLILSLQPVCGYYYVGGLTPQGDKPTPRQALDYVLQEAPWQLAVVVRSGRTGRLIRRPVEESMPSRFDLFINGIHNAEKVDFSAWIDPSSMDITNEETIVAALAAGTPRWRCDVWTRGVAQWSGMLTHTQLVSMVDAMERLQDMPRAAERHLRSVVMV